MTTTQVRVRRSPTRNDDGRRLWLVFCDICTGGGFLGLGLRPLRSAKDYATAVAWARQHAERHAAQTCPACGHIPAINDRSNRVESTSPGEYLTRCRRLRDRGLSEPLWRELRDSADANLLSDLESLSDEQISGLNHATALRQEAS